MMTPSARRQCAARRASERSGEQPGITGMCDWCMINIYDGDPEPEMPCSVPGCPFDKTPFDGPRWWFRRLRRAIDFQLQRKFLR